VSQSNIEGLSTSSTAFIPQKVSYEDFLQQYDGQYAEYVDDEVITPMSVTERHDDLTGFLLALLRIFIEEKKLGRVHSEPYQMKMVIEGKIKGREPDIFFVKTENLNKVGEKFFDGAANLVIEVISSDSLVRDTQEKFDEYESAGVEEYWIIDPHRRTANFYGHDENRKYKLLPLAADGIFESRVIAGLWLNTEWLWQDELPKLTDIIKEWKLL